MKLENLRYRVSRRPEETWLETVGGCLSNALERGTYPLRLALTDVRGGEAEVEATVLRYQVGSNRTAALSVVELVTPRRKLFQAEPFAAVQVVPTGVRCEFGGYAGDACPVTTLLASATDVLVTHPNAVNASELNEMAGNVLYVEGKSLDDFLLGHVGLLPSRGNRIGTFVDPSGVEYLDEVISVLNAARAAGGIDCGTYVIVGEEVGVRIEWSEAGCAVGTVANPEPVLAAVDLLLSHGVQAVGGVSVIHGVTGEMSARYLGGEIPNPSGGVEAILTHLVSKLFRIPTAHAPLPYYRDRRPKATDNPRASAEFISTPHYFSVLKGLARAPRLVPLADLDQAPAQTITVNNVGAIVVPGSCLGGMPALAAEFSGIPLIAVKENRTVLEVTNAKMRMENVIEVDSYLEAAGVVLALRGGLSLESLRRPLRTPPPVSLSRMRPTPDSSRRRLEGSPFPTVADLLQVQAERHGDRPAILAPGLAPLTYSGLWVRVQQLVLIFHRLGLQRGDRIALVLPGGPDLAVAFLAAAAGAESAPLNPAYREEELDFFFSDLGAKALITDGSGDSPAVRVAQARGIPVLELHRRPDPVAGAFTLVGTGLDGSPRGAKPVRPDDVALVLHTSGTTSRPKVVPLTHANLCASAVSVARTLGLGPEDRCLNVMPLFHVHGLIAALLASLAAGGSVVCAPGFYAPQFFGWMDEFHPTWYTAVPTMHQSILTRSAMHREVIGRRPLRFIRSSSASLPPPVMAELEAVFAAPVIEAYGMTEAAHQMASNPMPPRSRKPGSVGTAAGPEIGILDEDGHPLPSGTAGEIVIRGPNVMPGYQNNAEANQRAFTAGWFRTGDRGYLDDEGYLFITGRLKEIINRGGEKIAPREVEEALLAHAAVAEVAAFAVPDVALGEEVGAVVVLRAGASTTERELGNFAATRLADFKLPRVILFREELPKGPTGKVQRIGLAARLGLDAVPRRGPPAASEFVPPRTALETVIAEIWAEVLGLERVGVHDHFLDLGGDSMLAAQLVARVRDELRSELPQRSLFDAPTVAEQAAVLAELLQVGA